MLYFGLLKQKARASAIHFLISVIAIGGFALIVIGYWYPSILNEVDGVWEVFWILMVVDIVVGPTLTFIVFNTRKRRLKSDLVIILIVQLAGFSYGASTIYSERPLAVIFLEDTLYTASKTSYDLHGLSIEYLQKIPGSTPKFIFVGPPPIRSEEDLRKVMATPIRLNPEFSIPMTNAVDMMLHAGANVQTLVERFPQNKVQIERAWDQHNKRYPDALFFKLVGKRKSVYCLFSTTTFEFLAVVPIGADGT